MRKPTQARLLICISAACWMCSPTPASANVGIPMMECISPGLWILLPLVIVLEGIIALIVLRKGVWVALKVAALANIASTLVGVPIRWLLVALLSPAADHLIRQRAFESAWTDASLFTKLANAIVNPAGFAPEAVRGYWIWGPWAALMLVFFLLSVLVERWVARRLLGKGARVLAGRWAWVANAVSYTLIFASFWPLWSFIWGLDAP